MNPLNSDAKTKQYWTSETGDSKVKISSVYHIPLENVSHYNSCTINTAKAEENYLRFDKDLEDQIKKENFVKIEDQEHPLTLRGAQEFQFPVRGLTESYSNDGNISKIEENSLGLNTLRDRLTKDKCVQVEEQELHFTLRDLLNSSGNRINTTIAEQNCCVFATEMKYGLKCDKFVQVEEEELQLTLKDILESNIENIQQEQSSKTEDEGLQFLSGGVLEYNSETVYLTQVEGDSFNLEKNSDAELESDFLSIKEEENGKDESEMGINHSYSDSSTDSLLSQPEVSCISESGLTKYKCNMCTFEARFRCRIRKHILMHKKPSEVEMHKCKICGHETKYKAHIKAHMVIHKNAPELAMHKCEICTFETKHKSALKKHILTHKDASEVEMYKCNVCLFETKYKRGLIVHMMTHKRPAEMEMYKCELCAYESKHKRKLKLHMLCHKSPLEVTMYKCKLCPFETKYKKNINSHMLIHKDPSEVTTYKCDECPYETKYKRKVNRHSLTHYQ